MMMRNLVLLLVSLALSGLTASVIADDTHAAAAATAPEQAATAKTIDPAAYPLDVCIVSGEKLGEMGEPVSKVYDGREVKFCCKMCVKTFEKEPAKWAKKLDDAIIAAQKIHYPLTTCVVSGESLGGMGDPVDFVYKNQLVRFCCNGCLPAFNKEPEKYLAKLVISEKQTNNPEVEKR
jgi:YHS domain-containing protein